MENYQFKVGDECELMGVPGRIVEVFAEDEFDRAMWRSACSKYRYLVYRNGKLEPWHKEPALKLTKPAKRVVKKRYQMMVFKSRFGWAPGEFLVDENFKDSNGVELCSDYERKLMDNSPWIEVEQEIEA